MEAVRSMDAMSDLVSSIKKTNWHTIVVLVPGLTFLLFISKIYVDMSISKTEAVVKAEMIMIIRDMVKDCRSGASLSADQERMARFQ